MLPSKIDISSAGTPSELTSTAVVLAGGVLLFAAPSALLILLSLALLTAGFAVRPALALPLLAFALPFYLMPRELGAMAFSAPELIVLCLSVGAIGHVLLQRKAKLVAVAATLGTPLDGPIALFLAASLLSLLASEVVRVSLRELRTVILEPVVVYYLAIWLLQRRTDLTRLVWGLLLGGAAASLVGLYQYVFTDHVVAVEGARRILGPYLSPNHLALYLGRLLPLALAMVLYIPSTRVPAAALVAVLGAALLLTFSIGAWIATLLAVATVVLTWRVKALLALAGAVVALLGSAAPLLSIERVSTHISLTRGTSFIRLQVWESAIRMIADHPLLGVGMDNFLYHYRSSYLPAGAAVEPNLSHPHNLVLNFWLELGLLGVLSAAWMLASLARVWYRLWRLPILLSERALLAGIAGASVDFLVHGMVDNSYFLVDLAFQFWLLAAVLVLLWRQTAAGSCMAETPNELPGS